MPDFIGTYRLSQELQSNWRSQVDALATTAGIEIRAASSVGPLLTIEIRIPKNTPIPAREFADEFLASIPAAITGNAADSEQPALISSTQKETALTKLSTKFAPSLIAVTAATLAASPVFLLVREAPSRLEFLTNILGKTDLIVIPTVMIAVLFTIGRSLTQNSLDAKQEAILLQQATQVRLLSQTVAKEEDPKMRARLELARISLRSRASLMRSDADRLWKRSIWAYRGALMFFLLAISGPGVAAVLLLKSVAPDWRFMFGGLSLAAVPLGIGTALLRHDTRLRVQYQQTALDVAALERYELALDYARISSPGTYQKTMQHVITQLISAPTSRSLSRDTDNVIPAEFPLHGEPEIQKLFNTAVEKTREAAESMSKPKHP